MRHDGKPQRWAWEYQNFLNEHWGKSPEPEPEDGFAEEPMPPRLDDVMGWFRDAVPARHHSKICAGMEEIRRIAWLIAEWRLVGPPDARAEEARNRAHALQRALPKLKTVLQPVLDDLLQKLPSGPAGHWRHDYDPRCDPAVMRLIDLWNAAQLAAPYIGPPPRQGRGLPAWNIMAEALKEPIRNALKSIGAPRSVRPGAPFMKIISAALVQIDGGERESTAIEAALRTRRRLRKASERVRVSEKPALGGAQ